MTSLLVLATFLIVAWLWAVWQRDRRAAFMQQWLHVPLLGGIMCLLMALGLGVR